MLKQINDAIKFILNYAGVCIRRDRRDRSVVKCVCVGGGGGGGRLGERQIESERKETLKLLSRKGQP